MVYNEKFKLFFGDAYYAKNNKKGSVSVWSEIKDMIK